MTKIIFIDNFDSFSYNLVDVFRKIGCDVAVYRNTIKLKQLQTIIADSSTIIVLSPGPGNPKQAGVCLPLIKHYRGKNPIIGICLGHQAIVEAFGGIVERSPEISHGKATCLNMQKHPIFNGIEPDTFVGRYHSLAATLVPNNLDVIATSNQIVMAVTNEEEKICGLQFHPESILTTEGDIMLQNILRWTTGDFKC